MPEGQSLKTAAMGDFRESICGGVLWLLREVKHLSSFYGFRVFEYVCADCGRSTFMKETKRIEVCNHRIPREGDEKAVSGRGEGANEAR